MNSAIRRGSVVVMMSVMAACSSETGQEDTPRDSIETLAYPANPPTEFGGDRPVNLEVPSSYDPLVPTPLVVLLHGYSPIPNYMRGMFRMRTFSEDHGVLLVAPEGLQDQVGQYFWNGSDACCDFGQSGTDDVAYLVSLVEEIRAAYHVDSRRVYAMGHSNGSFMANTLACERPDLLAGIVSIAGAANPACEASGGPSVLHAHGTADNVIEFDGGFLNGTAYPGAEGTGAYWAEAHGCSSDFEVVGTLDYNATTPGSESEVRRAVGCPDGVDVELWVEPDGPHNPALPIGFGELWWSWMQEHPRPSAQR